MKRHRKGTTEELSAIENGVVTITITGRTGRAHTVLLDEADLGIWNAHPWYIAPDRPGGRFYVVRKREEGGKEYLHRRIANTPNGLDTDHRSGDTLDNRRANLRPCTRSQNAANAKLRTDNTSGAKGVRQKGDKWEAFIRVNYRMIYLGLYHAKGAAVSARRDAERALFGEFAPSARRAA